MSDKIKIEPDKQEIFYETVQDFLDSIKKTLTVKIEPNTSIDEFSEFMQKYLQMK